MARWFFLENLMEVSREVLESFFPGRFLEALKLFLIKIILLLREGVWGEGVANYSSRILAGRMTGRASEIRFT